MKRINFDFNQLIAFVAVAELGSFKQAAEEINLSAPALSRRIEKLESVLGVRLFNRTTREVKLTAVGRSFLEKVKTNLTELEQTALNISDIADIYIGQLSIACIPSIIDSLLIQPICSTLKQYPKIKIKILDGSESSVIENIKSGKADFGISFLSSPILGLTFTPLIQDQFIALVKKDSALAGKKKIEWQELHEERLITISQESGNRQMLNQQFLSHDLTSSICLEANRASSLPNLINAGLGIGILPSLSFTQSNHPDLVAIPLINPDLRRAIGILRSHGSKLSPAADLLLKNITLSANQHKTQSRK